MSTQVSPETRKRLREKYGNRYGYENCQTIGYIAKDNKKKDKETQTDEI